MIRTSQLAAGHGGLSFLSGLDLRFPAGQLWGIVGRNGSGKSTLLATLAGILKPVSGEVFWRDRPLRQWPRPQLALEAAFLPQHQPAVFPYTVEEFAGFGRLPWQRAGRSSRREDSRQVREAFRVLDLEALHGRGMTALSGGEAQRVCLAQVLVQNTPALLLDEPLAHLDLLHQLRVMRHLRELAERDGKLVLIAIHDLALAWRFCTHLLVLSAAERGQAQVRLVETSQAAQGAATFAWAFGVPFAVAPDSGIPVPRL